MTESEQAQTVQNARKWAASESAWLSRQELPQTESVQYMDAVLQIVDSQAQTIAEQAKEIERLENPAIEPEKCEFCNGKGSRDIELPADMGNHTTEDCQWCKGTGNDNADNICCADCGLFWNELVIARGQIGNIHACADCGGEWVRQ